MKIASLAILSLATLLFAGCSSTPTKVDHGPIKAATFSFVNTAGRPQPADTDQRAEVHKLVQEAITANLGAQGVARVATGGDVTVAYLIIAGNNATTLFLAETAFAEGDGARALALCDHLLTVDPRHFDALVYAEQTFFIGVVCDCDDEGVEEFVGAAD